jgi:O-methyltransferase involved in polyketide biosynthesis
MEHMVRPDLNGIPETMLWTLHNRAVESARSDGCIRDLEAERIYSSIEYDYERSFGPAEPSHAVRSLMFDGFIREFLSAHPDGVVVNLGEGLETQRFRVPGEGALWLSVDVPEAMAVRERFIAPDERHRHIACGALDEAWFDEVPRGRPVYVTAQGLLMYFDEKQVREHLTVLSSSFPGASYAFDVIPRWFSRKTTSAKGMWRTKQYRAPSMPWGINRHEIVRTLKTWVPDLGNVVVESFWQMPRGFVNRHIFHWFSSLPVLRRITPCVVRIRFADRGFDSEMESRP